jgi:tetratricopeptide (TPR) repeat protein
MQISFLVCSRSGSGHAPALTRTRAHARATRMSTLKMLLPAFVAGFTACGGLISALWPTMIELRSAQDEAVAAQRLLSRASATSASSVSLYLPCIHANPASIGSKPAFADERLLQTQVEAARESATRTAQETCRAEMEHREERCRAQIAQAVSDAEDRCPLQPECPSSWSGANDTTPQPDVEAMVLMLAAAANHKAERAAATGQPHQLPTPEGQASPSTPSTPSTPPSAGGSMESNVCIDAARVFVTGNGASFREAAEHAYATAAVKWVLNPPRDGAVQRRPGGSDEVLLNFIKRLGNVTVASGEQVIHRPDDLDMVAPTAGWGAALTSMRPGERAIFRFGSSRSGGSDAVRDDETASYELEVLSVTPVENLSPKASPTSRLLKKTIEGGVGSETPREGARVVVDLTVGSESGEVPTHRGLQFTLGDGTGGDGLRLVLMSMARSEVASVQIDPSLVKPPIARSSSAAGNETDATAPLVLTVRLVSFEQQRALEHMEVAELIEHIGRLKGIANGRFAAGDTDGACAEYERALRLLRLAEGDIEEAKVGKLRLALRLNGAACALKAQKYEQALAQADAALADVPSSTKAAFRRGQALQALGRLDEAAAAYSAVIEAEPASKEAHTKLSEVKTADARPGAPNTASAVQVEGGADSSAEGAGTDMARALAMSADELLAHVEAIKREANALFAAGKVEDASVEYARALSQLRVLDERGDAATAKPAGVLRLALRLNGAACALKAQKYEQALAQADAALADVPSSTKAAFRRGQALQALGRLDEAAAAYSAVIEAEPASKEAHTKLSEVRSRLGIAIGEQAL